MAQNPNNSKNKARLTIEEYSKIKGKLAESKLKLRFPWIIKACFIFPCVFFVFLVIYYLAHLRFLAEH